LYAPGAVLKVLLDVILAVPAMKLSQH